ncbi:MAG: glycosyltransferase N-terminal domain-containing protein, partial [bacterium]
VWRALYNLLFVPAMEAGLMMAGLFSEKVRRGIRGRLAEGERLRRVRSNCRENVPRVIVHCASAGELESAVPLMQALKADWNVDILLSYYSPSAVERAMKTEEPTDHFYLPADSRGRVRRLLEIIEPSLIVFVKHDYWPNLVWEAKSRGIPTALVNGNFRPDSKRLKRAAIPFGRAVLPHLSAIYAVARDDAHRFRFLAGDAPNIVISGDTRFDRVLQRALDGRRDQGALAELLAGRPVAVAGSTWHADEKRFLPAWKTVLEQLPDAVLVVAPHEPKPERLKQIADEGAANDLTSTTMTEVEEGVSPANLLIVDRVGVLAGMYGLGCVAYVGGAFGAGVHSVIEPAVFGIPVMFGPRYLMSHEARDLIDLGAAAQVSWPEQISEVFLDALQNGQSSRKRGEMAGMFVRQREGVSRRVAERLAALAGW